MLIYYWNPSILKLGSFFFFFFEGNGPSGICLSYLLSGYKPYLDTATAHPNPILYRKLQETKHLPITEQVKTSWNNLHQFNLTSHKFVIMGT